MEPNFFGLVEPKYTAVEPLFEAISLILTRIFTNFDVLFYFDGKFQLGGAKPKFVEPNKIFVEPFFGNVAINKKNYVEGG